MSQKRINPDEIESVKASYTDMSDVLSEEVDFIEDDSRNALNGATSSVKKLSKDIVSVVDGMDAYLNSVAQAFRQTDLDIASSIDTDYRISSSAITQKHAYRHKQEELLKQQNPYYPGLP